MNKNKKITLIEALLPIIILLSLIMINVILVFGIDSTAGPIQISLIISSAFAIGVGLIKGANWEIIQENIMQSIKSTMPAVLILLLIGSLGGSWLISGVIPTMIYYGLEILHPKFFLFTTVIICMIVSTSTGSSWATIGTVGLALFGIGKAFGFNEGIVAGAVISGSYFGDKISPLSDTTILSSAIAKSNLISHIKYMMITTIPAIVITLILFLILGFNNSLNIDIHKIISYQEEMKRIFNINLILLVAPLVLFYLIYKKINSIFALFIGSVFSILIAIIFQANVFTTLAGDNSLLNIYKISINAMVSETKIPTEINEIQRLFTSHGMSGMLNTVWLIITALIFGGTMESLGYLKKITSYLLKFANTNAKLLSTTTLSTVFMNFTASEQYSSIVISGKMFNEAFEDQNLAPENLSRTLEDAGTCTSVLCPWNTCNAYSSGVLAISNPLSFIPFCFFNILSPLIAIIIAFAGYKIKKTKNI